jgi:hypothetical protein
VCAATSAQAIRGHRNDDGGTYVPFMRGEGGGQEEGIAFDGRAKEQHGAPEAEEIVLQHELIRSRPR